MTMLTLLTVMSGTTAGQEFAGREKLRAHSEEFRREVSRSPTVCGSPSASRRGPRGARRRRPVSAIARNYYLSAAQYLVRDLPPR